MRGRRFACFTAVWALVVIAAGAHTLRGWIQEEWWIRQLGSKDEAEVLGALEKLGEVRSVRAIPRIVELHREREADSRVVECAVKIGSRALRELLAAARPTNSEKMAEVLAALWMSSLPVLLECVKDERSHVISIAARSLRRIDDERARSKLLAALDDRSQRVRFAAAWALAPSHQRLKAVRELLLESLRDSSPAIRIEAAKAIHFSQPHDALRELARFAPQAWVEALKDSEREVRFRAVCMLGLSDWEDVYPSLLEALDDSDGKVKQCALTAIRILASRIESSPIRRALVPRLVETFHGPEPHAAEVAARVLSMFGRDARALWPELLEYWKARTGDEYELFLLARNMGPGASKLVPALVAELEENPRRNSTQILRALEAIGPGARMAAAELLKLIDEPLIDLGQSEIRSRLQSALPAICPDGVAVLPGLLRVVANPQMERMEACCVAAVTLGGFSKSRATVLPALQALLEDEKNSVDLRLAAAEGLARLGRAARGAIPAMQALSGCPGANGSALAEALRSVDPANAPRSDSDDPGTLTSVVIPGLVRGLQLGRCVYSFTPSPAQTLLRIGKPAVPALADALRSDDVVVRSQAAEILGWIGPAAEKAILQLTGALEDEDAEVRRDATKALPKVSALRDFHQPPKSPAADPPKLSPLLQDADGVAISSPVAWSKRRAELRAAWLGYLGGLPGDRGPLDLEILETEEPTKFTRQLVRYRIEDGVTTEAYLLTPWYLPMDGSRKAAAVVVFHSTVDSHAGEAAGLDAYRSELAIGVHLVERGYVTLCPRCFIFDEGSDYAGNVAKMQARHPERKGMARMLLDGMRAADLLESLPHVDRDRIGCIGHSLGAKEALYAAAFDERFRASVFHEGGIGLVMSNWEAPWYLGPQIREAGFPREHHELLALVAPRAFLVVGGGEADDARSWAFVEPALGVFKLLGAESRFGWVLHDGGHNYTRFARAVAEEFLERGLR